MILTIIKIPGNGMEIYEKKIPVIAMYLNKESSFDQIVNLV